MPCPSISCQPMEKIAQPQNEKVGVLFDIDSDEEKSEL
jgi:hypothetical protein